MLHEIALQITDWPIAEQGVAQHSLVHILWLHLHCSDTSMDSAIVAFIWPSLLDPGAKGLLSPRFAILRAVSFDIENSNHHLDHVVVMSSQGGR
jgi:hypothetical protein